MARNYEEASATRRARLPVEAGATGRSSDSLPARCSGDGAAGAPRPDPDRARREDRHRPGRHQQDRAWLDLLEREDAPPSRRRPRCRMADGRQGDGLNPALSSVSSDGRELLRSANTGDRECRNARTSAPGAAAGLLAPCASGGSQDRRRRPSHNMQAFRHSRSRACFTTSVAPLRRSTPIRLDQAVTLSNHPPSAPRASASGDVFWFEKIEPRWILLTSPW